MKSVAGVGIIVVGVIACSAALYEAGSYRAKHPSDAPVACNAGPGELCPSEDFSKELKDLKALSKQQHALMEKSDVKELISVIDQEKGMSERMQAEITQTLNQNPGHQWDGVKEKFVADPNIPMKVGPNAPHLPIPGVSPASPVPTIPAKK